MLIRFLLIFIISPIILVAQNSYEQAETYFKQERFNKAKPLFEEYLKQHPSQSIMKLLQKKKILMQITILNMEEL